MSPKKGMSTFIWAATALHARSEKGDEYIYLVRRWPRVQLDKMTCPRISPMPRPQRPITGFTLLELLVVIVVIAALLALLIPGLASAKRAARAAKCLSNLHQLSAGFVEYAHDHGNFLPDSGDPWEDLLMSGYVPARPAFICPADDGLAQKIGISYRWRNDVAVMDPDASLAGRDIFAVTTSDLVLVFDAFAGWHAPDRRQAAALDGSARAWSEDDFGDELARPVQ
jgi:prepilin-type N-terminal cleavage/methylation domain-containing protein